MTDTSTPPQGPSTAAFTQSMMVLFASMLGAGLAVGTAIFKATAKPNPRPTSVNKQQLIEAAARYFHSGTAPVNVQQRLYNRYRKILTDLQKKHPTADLESSNFNETLKHEADAWWNKRAFRGSGTDW